MALYQNTKGNLSVINVIPAKKEKEIQSLVEANLIELLDIHFLASEYTTTKAQRIDTLAVDSYGAPVIIEYKRNKNDNIINQGLSYLRWLTEQKEDFFEMLMIKKLGTDLADKINLDWSNPRVVCIAESFNRFDKDTVEVLPMRIELFEYKMFEKDVFSLEPINIVESSLSKMKSSTVTKSTDSDSTDMSSEDRWPNTKQETIDMYNDLRERIMQLDDNVVEKFTTIYVAYRMTKNFAEIAVMKNKIKIHLRPIEYDDPRGLVDKIPDGYNWTMDRRVYLESNDDFEYVLEIIGQSYNNVK